MKFKPEISSAALSLQALEQDYTQACTMGRVHLGERCLFQKKFAGISYLPYSQILRAWLRQEEVKARLCCGVANFDQFYIVLACTGGQERRYHVEDKTAGQRCLEHIAVQNPEVKIGHVKPTE